MGALLKAIWLIAILKRTPQTIPASQVLLVFLVVIHFIIGVMLASSSVAIDAAATTALVGTTVMLAFIYLILRMRGMQQRFVQSVSALAGCEALIGLVALPMTYLFHAGGGESGLIALFSLLVFAWNIVVAAHIFQHTFNITPQQGVFYAVFYIFTSLIAGNILGVAA